jgi:quercetin dioxygenase-like cupin family protein
MRSPDTARSERAHTISNLKYLFAGMLVLGSLSHKIDSASEGTGKGESEMEFGVTGAAEGLEGIAWNVVGQTYVPKLLSENAFVWHATLPPDTFVPPHIHPTQDEWIFMLEGELEVEFPLEAPGAQKAGTGDTVRMPMGIAHGIFNRSGREASCVFGVAPARKLFALFTALDGVTDPAELVRLSALHEVDFLPPPDAG